MIFFFFQFVHEGLGPVESLNSFLLTFAPPASSLSLRPLKMIYNSYHQHCSSAIYLRAALHVNMDKEQFDVLLSLSVPLAHHIIH